MAQPQIRCWGVLEEVGEATGDEKRGRGGLGVREAVVNVAAQDRPKLWRGSTITGGMGTRRGIDVEVMEQNSTPRSKGNRQSEDRVKRCTVHPYVFNV